MWIFLIIIFSSLTLIEYDLVHHLYPFLLIHMTLIILLISGILLSSRVREIVTDIFVINFGGKVKMKKYLYFYYFLLFILNIGLLYYWPVKLSLTSWIISIVVTFIYIIFLIIFQKA